MTQTQRESYPQRSPSMGFEQGAMVPLMGGLVITIILSTVARRSLDSINNPYLEWATLFASLFIGFLQYNGIFAGWKMRVFYVLLFALSSLAYLAGLGWL